MAVLVVEPILIHGPTSSWQLMYIIPRFYPLMGDTENWLEYRIADAPEDRIGAPFHRFMSGFLHSLLPPVEADP